jgi:hypothetical protein
MFDFLHQYRFPNVKQYHLYFIITLLIIVFSSFMEWQGENGSIYCISLSLMCVLLTERNVMNEYGHVALRLTVSKTIIITVYTIYIDY